jgi:hypothetical protein
VLIDVVLLLIMMLMPGAEIDWLFVILVDWDTFPHVVHDTIPKDL